jgi:hypothetical protein
MVHAIPTVAALSSGRPGAKVDLDMLMAAWNAFRTVDVNLHALG